MSTAPLLKLENVSKSFTVGKSSRKVLEDVDMDFELDKITCLVGPSGSGKSTLLRIIAGLMQPSAGGLSWFDEHSLGFVFQSYGLYPFLSVRDNIGFGLKMQGMGPRQISRIVNQVGEEVGLNEVMEKRPVELSGGMKQRVGVGRALALNPTLLILDEPFSALDEFTAQDLRDKLLAICAERKLTVIMVTHLLSEAIQMADKIYVINKTVLADFDVAQPRPRDPNNKEFAALTSKIWSLLKKVSK